MNNIHFMRAVRYTNAIHNPFIDKEDAMKSIHITLTSLLSVILIVSALCLLPLSPLKAENHDPSPPQKEFIGPNLEPFAGAYKFSCFSASLAYFQHIHTINLHSWNTEWLPSTI